MRLPPQEAAGSELFGKVEHEGRNIAGFRQRCSATDGGQGQGCRFFLPVQARQGSGQGSKREHVQPCVGKEWPSREAAGRETLQVRCAHREFGHEQRGACSKRDGGRAGE